MSIPNPHQHLYPQSPSTYLSTIPLKMFIPHSLEHVYRPPPRLKMSIPNPPQHLYPQFPSTSLSPASFNTFIPNPTHNVYPDPPPQNLCAIPLKLSNRHSPSTSLSSAPLKRIIPTSPNISIPNLAQKIYFFNTPSKCCEPNLHSFIP